jgi:hypothetical protein
MAFFVRGAGLPMWLPHPLPHNLLEGRTLQLRLEDWGPEGAPEGPSAFITRDWFGPFLLSPASRVLRGRS